MLVRIGSILVWILVGIALIGHFLKHGQEYIGRIGGF